MFIYIYVYIYIYIYTHIIYVYDLEFSSHSAYGHFHRYCSVIRLVARSFRFQKVAVRRISLPSMVRGTKVYLSVSLHVIRAVLSTHNLFVLMMMIIIIIIMLYNKQCNMCIYNMHICICVTYTYIHIYIYIHTYIYVYIYNILSSGAARERA